MASGVGGSMANMQQLDYGAIPVVEADAGNKKELNLPGSVTDVL